MIAVPFVCSAGRAYVRHLDGDGVTRGITGPFATPEHLRSGWLEQCEVEEPPERPVLVPKVSPLPSRDVTQFGFTGSLCSKCGSASMVRSGTCELCRSCGETSGCS